jgi:hypothetical protein
MGMDCCVVEALAVGAPCALSRPTCPILHFRKLTCHLWGPSTCHLPVKKMLTSIDDIADWTLSDTTNAAPCSPSANSLLHEHQAELRYGHSLPLQLSRSPLSTASQLGNLRLAFQQTAEASNKMTSGLQRGNPCSRPPQMALAPSSADN